MANDESVFSGTQFIHITALNHHYYFYKNEKKVHNNTLKTSIYVAFSGSSDVKLQKLWLL